jgi:hypothetical protein
LRNLRLRRPINARPVPAFPQAACVGQRSCAAVILKVPRNSLAKSATNAALLPAKTGAQQQVDVAGQELDKSVKAALAEAAAVQ